MLTARCQRDIYSNTIEVIMVDDSFGKTSVGEKLTLKVIPPGDYAEPTFRLSSDGAQKFMDELWHCGLRPSEGSGSAGSLAATERHLKDMQKIAFDLLERDPGRM